MINPKRSEIWLVDLNPTIGQEIKKTRPVAVISADVFSAIAIRIIIPITTWQAKFATRPFMVPIAATDMTGLDQPSAGNVLQVRSISTQRFLYKLGQVGPSTMRELLAGLIISVDYPGESN